MKNLALGITLVSMGVTMTVISWMLGGKRVPVKYVGHQPSGLWNIPPRPPVPEVLFDKYGVN